MQQPEILPPRRSAVIAAPHAPADTPPAIIDRLMTIEEVAAATSLSRATIYREIAARRFPAAIPIARKRVAWSEAEIASWQRRAREAAHAEAAA